MKRLLAVLALVAVMVFGCGRNINEPPVIDSFSVQPAVVRVGEQARAVVQAHDPDGDRLVYDWFASAGCTIEAVRDGHAIVTCAVAGTVIVGVVVKDIFGHEAQASAFVTVVD